MLSGTHITNDHLKIFGDARRWIGCRVRARLIPMNPVPQGSTGTVAFVVADQSKVFVAVSWDCMTDWTEWYEPQTFLRLVSIEGVPVALPLPPRRRAREFTTVAAFVRLGRAVMTTRPVSRSIGEAEAGTVRSVIADGRRLMLAVSWDSPYASPDSMWFSRADYGLYLTECR